METTTRERSARDERSRAAQIQRAPWLLAAILALALIVRVGLYAQEPHPYDNSGLAVEHAELARNIDDHGRWFVVNLRALDVHIGAPGGMYADMKDFTSEHIPERALAQ